MTILQNADRNVSPKEYWAFKDDQLLVTSIFSTIQGEGPYAGHPAIFVRLAGCNRGAKEDMGCTFCDTAFQFDRGKLMSFAEITDEMARKDLIPSLTVITGGEPMLQDNLSRFVQWHRTRFPGVTIQIESNGDRIARNWPARGYAQIVVSPKVTKNGYAKPTADAIKRAFCFKFVISADPESPYYALPNWALNIRADKVYVSPLTVYKKPVPPGMMASAWDQNLVDHAATRLNYRRAAQLALEHGIRISIQQHLFYEVE